MTQHINKKVWRRRKIIYFIVHMKKAIICWLVKNYIVWRNRFKIFSQPKPKVTSQNRFKIFLQPKSKVTNRNWNQLKMFWKPKRKVRSRNQFELFFQPKLKSTTKTESQKSRWNIFSTETDWIFFATETENRWTLKNDFQQIKTSFLPRRQIYYLELYQGRRNGFFPPQNIFCISFMNPYPYVAIFFKERKVRNKSQSFDTSSDVIGLRDKS